MGLGRGLSVCGREFLEAIEDEGPGGDGAGIGEHEGCADEFEVIGVESGVIGDAFEAGGFDGDAAISDAIGEDVEDGGPVGGGESRASGEAIEECEAGFELGALSGFEEAGVPGDDGVGDVGGPMAVVEVLEEE
jgi:hypothetical protein